MSSLLVYKGIIAILLVGVVGASGVATYFYQQQSVKVSQSSDLNNQVNQLEGQISALNSQIANLNKQIDSLNSQISQLQTLNTQLGGNNAQLISQTQQLQFQVSQLQSRVSQLQSQVSQLQDQVSNLNQIVSLQRSRVVANQVTVDRQSFTTPFPNVVALINIGSIQYAGYLRVSWPSGPRMSFWIQEFDINITTPIGTSGVYSVPVSANATGNAWFQCYDYYFVNGVYVCSSPFTYSITYWY